jgi:hypothetical protein
MRLFELVYQLYHLHKVIPENGVLPRVLMQPSTPLLQELSKSPIFGILESETNVLLKTPDESL